MFLRKDKAGDFLSVTLLSVIVFLVAGLLFVLEEFESVWRQSILAQINHVRHQIAQLVCDLQAGIVRTNEGLQINKVAILDSIAIVEAGYDYRARVHLFGDIKDKAVSQMVNLVVVVY